MPPKELIFLMVQKKQSVRSTLNYSFLIIKFGKMSDALIWELIKDNNSFLTKRGRDPRSGPVQFSSEPGNLLGVNSFKYSGLANSKAAGLSIVVTKPKAPAEPTSTITLTTKVI